MRNLGILLAAVLFMMMAVPTKSYAVSTAECEIWLCLPGGFPSGCEPAHSAFRSRIKSGKPPLPPLSACGSNSTSNYKMGYEPYENCKTGFKLQADSHYSAAERSSAGAKCVETECQNYTGFGRDRERVCDKYDAVRKPKPHFIQLWMDGQYQGKFYYSY